MCLHIMSCIAPACRRDGSILWMLPQAKVLHHFESTCSVDGPRTATGPDLNGISRTVNTYQVGSYVLHGRYYEADV